MLVTMTDRGPDSAGIAIYADKHAGRSKFTIQSKNPERDFQDLPNYLDKNLDRILDFRCLLYTSPSPRDRQKSRMPSSA